MGKLRLRAEWSPDGDHVAVNDNVRYLLESEVQSLSSCILAVLKPQPVEGARARVPFPTGG